MALPQGWLGQRSPGATDASLYYPCLRVMEAAAPMLCAKAQGMARGRAPVMRPTLWVMVSPAVLESAW